MTHTPGPWEFEECYKHNGYTHHIRTDEVGGFALVDGFENANLIAAAPDLLAFIKKPYPIEAYDKWREAGDAASAEALDMHEGERRALIAKAEGE